MTHFPQPHENHRAVRVEFSGRMRAALRLEDGRYFPGRLRKVSLTGGLLRISRPLVAGTLAEVIFDSVSGPVLGLAEMLNPVSATLKCLQPFKFLLLDDHNYQSLNRVILASQCTALRGEYTARRNGGSLWGAV